MNRTQLVEAIAKSTKLTKVDINKTLDAFIATTKKELKAGREVNLIGFLNLKKEKRKARTGRNPQTGATIKIAAKNVVKARVGKTLTDALN